MHKNSMMGSQNGPLIFAQNTDAEPFIVMVYLASPNISTYQKCLLFLWGKSKRRHNMKVIKQISQNIFSCLHFIALSFKNKRPN